LRKETTNVMIFKRLLLAMTSLVLLPAGFGQEADSGAGAVILAERTDPVIFRDAENQKIDGAKMIPGVLLPEGYWVETGPKGNALLLLSNGTVVTVAENSKMRVEAFNQEPFEADGKLINDLKEEPSSSSVLVNLEIGSLVVQTKKLNKKSNFEITSPLGTAGIRGTEFKMGVDPKVGIELDVTESTVAFTPRGATRPISVSAGKGLTVKPNGVTAPRPLNPPVAREINTVNTKARQSVGEMPISYVKSSMGEASLKRRVERKRNNGTSPRRRNEAGEKDGPSDSEGGGSKKPGSRKPSSQQGRANLSGEFLENNADVTQARKTGKVSKLTGKLAKLALTIEETNRFHALAVPDQVKLLKESGKTARRILAIERLTPTDVHTFFQYSPQARSQMFGLPDVAFTNLLKQGVDEDLVILTLNNQTIAHSQTGTDQTKPAPDLQDAQALSLGASLKDSSSAHVLEELLALSGGVLTDEVIRQGEVAERLLRDYRLGASDAGDLQALSSIEVLSNPFYQEISSLYGELETDLLVAGSANFLGGKNMIVEANSLALAPYFAGANGQTIVLSSVGSMSLEGDFSWADKPEDAARLVVMSAGEMNLAKGMTLKSATGDLVLSSRMDIALDGVEMDVYQEAVIRGMRDVSLVNTRIGADSMATIKAVRNLNVDGLSFSRSVSNILMEATTIRLSNVNFPAASAVRLNSLKGAIDGRYPNFGTAIPAASQVGRVNFLENVSSGGNRIMTRQAFDQYGQNITIGKTNRP
jgi:hypothetical protein